MAHSVRGAREVVVVAQAKVNLRLRVLARETSGFHQIETLLLRLDLADSVIVRRTTSARTIDVVGNGDLSAIGPPERNLAWRAAESYFAATQMQGGFAIEITKRIPIGGGLGGGSADAGAVLRALQVMSEEPWHPELLLSLAARLGADVPFLTTEHALALAWGRGERMLALDAPPCRAVLLVVPPFGINTAAAYCWLAEARDANAAREGGEGSPTDATVLDVAALSDWDRISPLASNDFESSVGARYPEIDRHIGALRSLGCPVAMMSGSGSTVFGVGSSAAYRFAAMPSSGDDIRQARYIVTQTATRVEPPSVME